MAKTPDKTDQLKLQLKDLTDKYTRALADYQNLEKRIERERGQFAVYTKAVTISPFLDILDDLQRAASHLSDNGLDLVIDQFNKTLKEQGITQLIPQDEPFDPATMDCVEQAPGPKDQVISVSQKGYRLEDHLIRPAKVTVGSGDKKHKS